MRSKSILVMVALVLGAGVGLLAAEAIQLRAELPVSHYQVEKFQMKVGVTAHGSPRTLSERFEETRVVVRIPDHYGQLLELSTDGDQAVLWFQDHLGQLRNASIKGVKGTPFLIAREQSSDLKVETEKVR